MSPRPRPRRIPQEEAEGEEGLGPELGRGRSTRTPFVLFFGVNAFLLGLAAAIVLLVLIALLLWRVA